MPADPLVARLIEECDAGACVKTDHEARQSLASFRHSLSEQDLSPIVSGNIRLIVWAAVRYNGEGDILSDLVQEGVIGFLAGLKKFDLDRTPAKPVCNYALNYAKKYILHYLEINGRTMRIGRKAQQTANKALQRLEKAIMEYESSSLPIDAVMQDETRTYRLGALDALSGMVALDADEYERQVPDVIVDPGADPVVILAAATKDLSSLSRQMLFALYGISSETIAVCCRRNRIDLAEGRRIAEHALVSLQQQLPLAPGASAAGMHPAAQLLLF